MRASKIQNIPFWLFDRRWERRRNVMTERNPKARHVDVSRFLPKNVLLSTNAYGIPMYGYVSYGRLMSRARFLFEKNFSLFFLSFILLFIRFKYHLVVCFSAATNLQPKCKHTIKWHIWISSTVLWRMCYRIDEEMKENWNTCVLYIRFVFYFMYFHSAPASKCQSL